MGERNICSIHVAFPFFFVCCKCKRSQSKREGHEHDFFGAIDGGHNFTWRAVTITCKHGISFSPFGAFQLKTPQVALAHKFKRIKPVTNWLLVDFSKTKRKSVKRRFLNFYRSASVSEKIFEKKTRKYENWLLLQKSNLQRINKICANFTVLKILNSRRKKLIEFEVVLFKKGSKGGGYSSSWKLVCKQKKFFNLGSPKQI